MRQPCFVFSENCNYSLSDEIRKLIVCSFKNYATKQDKASSSFELAFGIYRSSVAYFASKTSIVSINYAKANSSNLSGLEHSLCLPACEHNQEKERASQERGKEPVFSFRVQMRACPHCTEKCVRQLAHICSEKSGRQLAHICSEKSGRQLDHFCSIGRGSVRAATAGTVAPSHPLLKFGKLTIKFEMLCKKLKICSFRTSAERPADSDAAIRCGAACTSAGGGQLRNVQHGRLCSVSHHRILNRLCRKMTACATVIE